MQSAPTPIEEAERLQALRDYHSLDTATEEAFDNLTKLASTICGVPIALVSLIDEHRQWFKSHHGLDIRETPRDIAFCAHAILETEIFEVEDTHADPRFADNPLVTGEPHIRFYAGAQLVTPQGHCIGTVCVIGREPQKLDDSQRASLQTIADQVMTLLELRRSMRQRAKLQIEKERNLAALERRNEQVTRFAYRSSHDLRAPAIQIQNLARLTRADLEAGLSDTIHEHLQMIETSSERLLAFIDGTVEISRAELMAGALQPIDFRRLADEAVAQVNSILGQHDVDIRIEVNSRNTVHSEFLRLRQMLAHLLSNSVKYANHQRKGGPFVRIRVEDDGDSAHLTVEDNGLGIPEEHQPRYFDLYQRFHPDVCAGSGVGTAIVRRHAEAIGASITIDSDGSGTRVHVLVPNCEVEVAM